MDVEIGATKDGKVTALKVSTTADHGAFDAAADPRKYPAGMFGIVTGSYDFPTAFAEVDAYFTNKAPGGIAYRCSFRVTEAAYAIERGMDILARQARYRPGRTARAKLRQERAVSVSARRSASSTTAATTSDDCTKALDKIGYGGAAQRTGREAQARRADGHRHLDVHRVVGAGPGQALRHHGHQDVRQRRDPHPSDRLGHRARRHAASGQGHETTWAQIVAEELGLDPQDLLVEEGDTDTAPYGLGTYASRSTPVAGGALALAARRIREKAKQDRGASARGVGRRRRVEGLQVLASKACPARA